MSRFDVKDPMFTRRGFLLIVVGNVLLTRKAACAAAGKTLRHPAIMTVLGPIRPKELGLTLSHEHVLVDFVGAEKVSRERYDAEEAFRVISPFLVRAKTLGCRGFVECTPSYIGRDPALLARLARTVRLNILTNTGYYGAGDNKFLPRHAWTESAEELSARWLSEWRDGIEGTGVRPGFIKIGVAGDTLPDLHRKLVRSAALTHKGAGLVIASHTGPAKLAVEQIAVLREEGVPAEAFIWVHAQAEPTISTCLEVARQGCWVSFDGFSATEAERYVEVVRKFSENGRLGQLLLSHDAGWFRPGEPGGGNYRGYEEIFEVLLPSLRRAGVTKKQIQKLLVTNPARAFRIRPAGFS